MRKLLALFLAAVLVHLSALALPAQAIPTWPVLVNQKDSLGDVPASLADFDVTDLRLTMDTDGWLTFAVTLNGEPSEEAFEASDIQVMIEFDVNGDQSPDYFTSTKRPGDFVESSSGETNYECLTDAFEFKGKTVEVGLGSICFASDSISFRAKVLRSGETIDSVPQTGWAKTSLRILDLFNCSKAQRGQFIESDEGRLICVLTKGTVDRGTWKLIEESKLKDSDFLKMYSCTKSTAGVTVEVPRTNGGRVYECYQSKGKWAFLTQDAIAALQAKAAADAKAKQAKAEAAARAKRVASARFVTQKAYYHCRLDSGLVRIFVSLADGGRTLVMNSVGRSSFYPQFSDFRCVANYLKMPASIRSKIDSTRAIDGLVEGKWGSVSAFWNYHPDQGMDITFTLVK